MGPLLECRALENIFLSMLDKISHGLAQMHDGQFVLHMCTPLTKPDNSLLSISTLSNCAFISACVAYNDENCIELKLLCVYTKMKHSIANYFIKTK